MSDSEHVLHRFTSRPAENQMHAQLLLCLIVLAAEIHGTSFPYIQGAFLEPNGGSNADPTVLFNRTCEQCLCEAFTDNITADYAALNCFANQTCQLFPRIPPSYTIQRSPAAQLYFLRGSVRDPRQCCTLNITVLINRLKNATPVVVPLAFQAGAFGYDDTKPNEAVVIGASSGNLYWFNPFNLIFLRNGTIASSNTIALHNHSIFTAYDNNPTMYMFDDSTLALSGNITYPSLKILRKFLFLNNGQTIVVPTQFNNSITMISVQSTTQYTVQELPCPLSNLHGAVKINDTFFYVSSWSTSSIGSYKYENATWKYRLLVNRTDSHYGAHIAVDECGRVWFVNPTFGLRIYDASGVRLAEWDMGLNTTNWIYDVLLLPNFVVVVSYWQGKKLVQYDPLLTCT